QTLVLIGSTAQLAIEFLRLPSIGLYMTLILHLRSIVAVFCRSWRCRTFFYQPDLYRFQTLCISRSSSLLRGVITIATFCPVKPAISLTMHTVIDIIFFGICSS